MVNQVEISLANRSFFEDGNLDYCLTHQVTPMAWSPLGGGGLMGMFRWIKEDRVSFYELIVIEQAGEFVMMRIKHFSPGLKGWEEKDQAVDFLLVHLQGNTAVFFQQGKSDQWLVYRLDAPNRLAVFFHSEDDPQKSEQVLTFSR